MDIPKLRKYIQNNIKSILHRVPRSVEISHDKGILNKISLDTRNIESNLIISKKLMKHLLEVRDMFLEECGLAKYTNRESHSDIHQPVPLMFILGKRDGVIQSVELFSAYSGCGYFGHPHTNYDYQSYNKAIHRLLVKGCTPVGIARVGLFDNSTYDFGREMEWLYRMSTIHGTVLLSIGRIGMMVHVCRENGEWDSGHGTKDYVIR